MTREAVRTKRLIGLFLLAYLLFNYPLISLVNLPIRIGGIPVLYAYIFGVWIVIILLIALVSSRDSRAPR